MATGRQDKDIAIIGMAGRFPDADNLDKFWSNINGKVNSIRQFSDGELVEAGISADLFQSPRYVRAKGYLENAEYFDADFFKFSKHDAEILDPQYRLFFEVVWEALENAAYVPKTYQGKMGLFAGSSNIDGYYLNNLLRSTSSTLLTDNFTIALHNAKDFLSTLIAYKLNFRGPAITVQTACSTSLVAICMACQSLLNFESDIALAGGTSITMPLKSGYLFQDGMMLSPTGKCRAFDKNADGTVLGNGLGVVVLKRLNEAVEDGDYIHAVIKGCAVNNDGSSKIGFTAPSVSGQQNVIMDAMQKASISPDMISYIETHGTGTILGDLIEIEALTKVFKGHSSRIILGSVKPNIGHLDAASGVANLIKVALALKNKTLPPTIHFEAPSSQVDFSQTLFSINTISKAWETAGSERYAGVSSFGMGGTNAHVVLTEAPIQHISEDLPGTILLVLSAKTATSLNQMKNNLADFLDNNRSIKLADVAYTLQVGREHFKCRDAYICSSVEEAVQKLRQSNSDMLQASISFHSDYLNDLARRWLEGDEVDWSVLYNSTKCYRIPLPTYAFERKKYWVTRDLLNLPLFKSVNMGETNKDTKGYADISIIESKIKKIFERFFVQTDMDIECSFQALGGDSLVALLITHEINKSLDLKLPFSIFDNNLSIRALSEHIANSIENQ